MRISAFLTLFCACSASKILLMFPMSRKSHVNSFVPLFQKLSENGHNITMVTSFTPKLQIPNCTYILVRNIMDDFIAEKHGQESLNVFREFRPFYILMLVWSIHLQIIEKLLEEDHLRDLALGNYTFDLMITEALYLFEIFVAFGHIFNIPVISIDAHPLSAWSSYLTGNVNPYSTVPNYRWKFTDEMTWWERVGNTLLNLQEMGGTYYYYLPQQEYLMRKYLSYEKYEFPPLLDMLKNISLTLVDTHFSLGYVRPYLPHTIEVGGLALNKVGELDEEFKNYLDGSKNGVIYVSFGSTMNMSQLPDGMMDVFISAFQQLKQNIIMKWESEELPNKPENVKTLPWLPQSEILAHPNCRLFISHGGFHGLSEAVYHKVPLVMIPFYSDQYYNSLLAEKEGFAYVLNNQDVTSENLLNAIYEVLDNAEYKKNIERRSLILKDRDQNSLDKAVYWVEYVLRHNGAKHLAPSCLKLNTFQYFLLDVIIVLALAVLAAFTSLFLILRGIQYCIRYFLSGILRPFCRIISRYRNYDEPREDYDTSHLDNITLHIQRKQRKKRSKKIQ